MERATSGVGVGALLEVSHVLQSVAEQRSSNVQLLATNDNNLSAYIFMHIKMLY